MDSELVLPPRYRDLGRLGLGGFAEVRRAHDARLETEVALKLLLPEHLDRDSVRAAFESEARITAALSHPGVVPVHDRGVLADGRPWFTMKMVKGTTLRALCQPPARPSTHRLVEILARVCEAAGHAHSRGIVHRDLKPDNVMVGPFGEVMVMDWGIARRVRELTAATPADDLMLGPDDEHLTTGSGEVLGTLPYMAPEQARGDVRAIGPTSDVFALGLILWELLFAQRAYPERGPALWARVIEGVVPAAPATLPGKEHALLSIALEATRSDPDARPPHAGALAEALRAWLEGATQRARADELLARSRLIAAELSDDRALCEKAAREAREAASVLDARPSDEARRGVWQLEDRARDLRRDLIVQDEQRLELLRAGLQLDPDNEAIHAELAREYRARVERAESTHDADVALRWEIMLAQHDRGEHAAFLAKSGTLSLEASPLGARVLARRWVERGRQLVLEGARELGRTPLTRLELPAASYLLEIGAEGCESVQLPVWLRRDAQWPGPWAAAAQREPLVLPPGGVLSSDELFVPAGPAWIGGDPLAVEPLPLREVWVSAFVAKRDPVTNAEYLTFLNDLVERGEHERALSHAPRRALGRGLEGEDALALVRLPGGLLGLGEDRPGRSLHPRHPVTMVSWHDAMAYSAWLSARTGRAWRPPGELEWEKLARGVDGRAFPWGDHPEVSFAAMLGSNVDAPGRVTVDEHPADRSPYGARGCAGNARTWCSDAWKLEGPPVRAGQVVLEIAAAGDDALRTIKGGTWSTGAPYARAASRYANRASERLSAVGVRLVCAPWW